MRWLSGFWRTSRTPEGEAALSDPGRRALLRRLEVQSRRELATHLAGEVRSRLRGRGMEFAGLRPYQPGDDIRDLDWNVTARSGTPHIRLYRQERSRTLTLLVDRSPSCSGSLHRLQLRCASLLAFASVANRDRLALVRFAEKVEQLLPPGTGRQHALTLLHHLTTAAQSAGTDLTPALEAALALNRRPGMILLLSDFHAPLPEALLRRLAARHDLVALVLRDPAESAPEPGGVLRLRASEGGEERLLDLSSPARCAAVSEAWAAHDTALFAQLRRLGVDPLRLEAGSDPLPTLLQFFRRRPTTTRR